MTRALAVVAMLLVAAPASDAGPHTGRIVRVERPRTGTRGTPRVCRLSDVQAATCWGKPPAVGEVGYLIAPRTSAPPSNRGQVRIDDVTPDRQSGGCSAESWTVKYKPIDANLKDVETWQTWVVIDLEVGRGAALVDTDKVDLPDEYGTETPWLAIDRDLGDSDDAADFLIMAYGCDATGQRLSSPNGGYCLDYWTRGASRWGQVRRDIVVPNCTP